MKAANYVEVQNLSSNSPLYHLLASLSSASTQTVWGSLIDKTSILLNNCQLWKKFQEEGGKEIHNLKNVLKGRNTSNKKHILNYEKKASRIKLRLHLHD
jgi:hypothetical protein